jgi:hypothetical protein
MMEGYLSVIILGWGAWNLPAGSQNPSTPRCSSTLPLLLFLLLLLLLFFLAATEEDHDLLQKA